MSAGTTKNPARVLYMEDDDGLRKITRIHLQRAGYLVDVAEDGETGLALCESGSYDVLLIDQTMPRYSGLEVLRILSARGPLPPVIMVTVEHKAEVAVEALKQGAADYIIKDLAGNYLEILPAVIEQVLSHRRLLQEKELTEEHLRQAQKMKAIGTLAGGIAHDFNNILAGIINYAILLQQEGVHSTSFQSDLKKIEQLAWRGANLTRALLAFAREENYQPRPLDVAGLVDSLLPIISETANKNIDVRRKTGPGALLVVADPALLTQAVLNLCINGCEAMPRGGTLTVATGTDRPDQALLLVYPRLKGKDCVSIRVSDTGAGMDSETREQIFNPFFTTKEDKSGTGLGLSTAIGIVEGHGGCIEVDSEPERGSSFTIFLPSQEDHPC
ncbi:MAG: response regulator [PVC group bacterium]